MEIYRIWLLLPSILYLLLEKMFYVGATLHIVFQISFQTTKVVTGDIVSYCNFDS